MERQVLADRYELRDLLGEGGMARVYEGYDRVLARRVAVKLLRDDIGGGRALRERMLREARAAASFHHPNAVAVFDTGLQDRTPYIVMELVEGGTLADELAASGSLDPPRALDIADQVLSALAAAHTRGLVHRDVKPANIMLPPEGGAKLADFGIAKGVEEVAGLTVEGQVLGTPTYMSPEQVAGKPATARSDVYAMGVVLYEMLAGTPPFTAENPFAVAIAHTEDTPPRLDRRARGLAPGLVALVHRCLEKDPARRFADAESLRTGLREVRGAAAGAAPRPTAEEAPTLVVDRDDPPQTAGVAPAAAPRPARRRNRALRFAVILAVLLLLGGFLALQALEDTPAPPPRGLDEADPDATPDEAPQPTDSPEPTASPEPSPDASPEPDPEPEPEPDPGTAEPTPPDDDSPVDDLLPS